MAGRLVAYQEDLSESTASGSTVTKASVSANLVSGTTYALFWSYQVGSNDTSSIARIRCMDATGGASRGLNQFRARDTSDYNWAGNVGIYTAAATASRTFEIEFLRLAGTGTVKIKNVRLLVLELTAVDAAAAAVGNQVTSSATFVSALDLNFTPATSGDYLFIASGAIANGSTEIEFLTPGATSVNNLNSVLPYVGLYQPWSVVWRENGIAASPQTASIRWRSAGGSQNMQAACIVAIRIDGLAGFQNTQDDSADAGTDTSYTATESLAATGLQPDERETIVIAAATVTDGSTSDSSFVEFRDAGTQIVEGVHEASGGLTTTAGLIGYKATAASTSITFDLRRKSESSNTTTIEFASIALLELTRPVNETPSSGSLVITGGPAAVVANQGALLAASTGTVVIAGQPAAFTSAPLLETASGELLISGQPAAISLGLDVTPAPGAVQITGQPAVIETGSPLFVTPSAGAVQITGQPVTVETTVSAIVEPVTGSVAIQGRPVTLIEGQGIELTPAAGAIEITGQPATIVAGIPGVFEPVAGSVAIEGQPVTLRTDAVLAPPSGAVVVEGKAATVLAEANAVLTPASGHVAVSGKAATLVKTDNIVLSTGSRRIYVYGHQAWIETSDNGGVLVVADPPEARGGQTWRSLVLEVNPDWPIQYQRTPDVYEFSNGRKFGERRSGYR